MQEILGSGSCPSGNRRGVAIAGVARSIGGISTGGLRMQSRVRQWISKAATIVLGLFNILDWPLEVD